MQEHMARSQVTNLSFDKVFEISLKIGCNMIEFSRMKKYTVINSNQRKMSDIGGEINFQASMEF